jgi:hypothetical protein
MTFSVIRRFRELIWVGFGLAVLVRRHALQWLGSRGAEAAQETEEKKEGPRSASA